MILSLSICAFAYNTLGYRLSGGVGNSGNNTRYYWLDSSATPYTSIINSAMYSWNHTASNPGVRTPIWFQPVASKTNSVMDIYVSSASNSSANGYTTFFAQAHSSTTANPRSQNWVWCKVSVYAGNFSGSNHTGARNITMQSTFAHEMGHVFGLDHTTTSSTVMCPAATRNSSVLGPRTDDCNGINALY